MDLDLRSLIGKLDQSCHRALEAAAGMCGSRTHYNVELEHWLLKLNEDPSIDLRKILAHFEVRTDELTRGLSKALDRMKTGNARTPALAPSIIDAIKDAWTLSSVQFGLAKIRSGVLILAIVSNRSLASQIQESCPELASIKPKELEANLVEICDWSAEDDEMISQPGASATMTQPGVKAPGGGPSKCPSLDQYTIDLTAAAKEGKIDPVLGRDPEIRQIVDILTRRRQNNPILTGEAGVGKTAVVEGFALRVAQKDVPPPLQNIAVRALDLGLLQAGAGVKGEFENRLKSVIEEVKSSPTPIVLFIDEAHTMIGAGGQAGQGDAANLLKPALARGDLRTIAATTWAEYKKYFEKDAALARRFQVVKVDEPTEESAVRMMRGLVAMLESHHDVIILDEAVEASVRLSARYISGRQLPDKSVSLLDTACARVAISQSGVPGEIEDARRRIAGLETEQRILRGEEASGGSHPERLTKLDKELAETRQQLSTLEERWKKEKELVDRIRDARAKLRLFSLQENGEDKPSVKKGSEKAPAPKLTRQEADALRESLGGLDRELAALQGETPLLSPFVDGQTVASVISAWTGIPAGQMLASEIQTILNLKDKLAERIIGQDHALTALARRIQTSRANMDDPKKPIGVFLFVGPSGVGKTETAIAIADLLYGGERNLITINMSEYQESHTVSGLKGSPPGYVGYGEGGVLTEAVRKRPYSVVLLDEVEKAHKDVMELFFQVFDKGVLEDGEGRQINFKNTVILLTSNVGTDKMMALCADPATKPDPDALALAIRPELEKVFPLALLGRFNNVVPFYPISDDVMKRIIRLKLGRIATRVMENHGIPFSWDDAVVDAIASRCQEVSSGARNAEHILTNTLLPEMSREFLARMGQGEKVKSVSVSIAPDGEFAYKFG